MNAMPKASTYKGVRSSLATKPAALRGQTRATKKSAPAKESAACRDRRILAEIHLQLRQINATLDEIEQSRRERNAW
jgi:hypothetical protein